MTVLRHDISAHTGVIGVDAPLSSPTYPFFRDIGSETVKVTDGADTTEWQVERGVAGTQAARHSRSTFLVPNAAPFGLRLVDLGVTPAVASLYAAGPHLLYTPAAGELVIALLVNQDTAISLDGLGAVNVGISSAALDAIKFLALGTSGGWKDSWAIATQFTKPIASTSSPIYVGMDSGNPGFIVGPWQANHVYGVGEGVTGAGHGWYADPIGTSGGSAPNFAANFDGTVVDNDITWYDDGAVSTSGSAHLYALVAAP